MTTETAGRRHENWITRASALVVAGVAAYSSYGHQRDFALDGGADPVAAALWPLSVDGLVILASLGLLRQRSDTTSRARRAVWFAFLLGVAVSLAANIAAAPALAWQPIVVAGWPPLALLLATELILHSRRPTSAETKPAPPAAHQTETPCTDTPDVEPTGSHDRLAAARQARSRAVVSRLDIPATNTSTRTARADCRAEDLMWNHYQRTVAQGRIPTGAELDRIAGTSNYGRRVLARWRNTGRLPPAA